MNVRTMFDAVHGGGDDQVGESIKKNQETTK